MRRTDKKRQSADWLEGAAGAVCLLSGQARREFEVEWAAMDFLRFDHEGDAEDYLEVQFGNDPALARACGSGRSCGGWSSASNKQVFPSKP